MRVTFALDSFSPACAEGLLTLAGIPREGGASLLLADAAGALRLGDGLLRADYAVVFFRNEDAAERDAAARLGGMLGERCFPVRLPYSVAETVALLRALASADGMTEPPRSGIGARQGAQSGSPARESGIGDAARERETDDANNREITLIPARRAVAAGKREARLTEREFALFMLLYEARGAVVTRDAIYAALTPGRERKKGSNLADVYAQYLRRKLKPLFGDGVILSVRGAGYSLRLPARE
ncbi:MAG: winged helix-turn-helix transcriptional regulator [Clostridia bacterium]|nr:winged helix-turn-helix transcriptional regulator [Clostridia bacterium]